MLITEQINGYEFGILNYDDAQFPELQSVIHDRFVIEGYINPLPEREIRDEFITSSIYFCAIDKAFERIVGGFRMISPEAGPLPMQNEFSLYPGIKNELSLLSPNEYVEIGRLAVLPGYNIAECLYRQGWKHSIAMKHKVWTISADKRLWVLFRRYRGLIFRQSGEDREYLGSVTTPGIATLDELAHSMKEKAPRFFSYMNGPTPDYLYSSP